MNIHLLLQMAADAMGERQAVVSGEARLTFSELDAAARTVANHAKGYSRLVYYSENAVAKPAGLFGAALAGIPFVPINYRLSDDQIAALMARVSPALLITDRNVTYDGIDTVHPGDVLIGEPYGGEAPDVEGAVAVELFTSGTTGEPKSAVLRHSNLMAYVLGTKEFMSAGEDEATLISIPPYHIAGVAVVISSTYSGTRMVQLPNFSPQAWIDLASQEKVTSAFLVPTMMQRIIDYTEGRAGLSLPYMQSIAYGGGKMPISVIEKAMALLPHVDFINAYGLTETSATICMLGPDDHRTAFESDDPAIRRRLGSAGMPLPTIELQIRNEDGKICQPEETGLVWVRGEQVSGEYKGTGSQLDKDGWFLTKDRGFVDSAGYLFIDGRADDVIVRGGENMSPGEIEDVIRSHAAIKDVAAVAVADEEWGEAVGLAIVCRHDVDDNEIRELVRANLRSSRVPSVIKRYDELPYNETGKLLRRVIRDSFAN